MGTGDFMLIDEVQEAGAGGSMEEPGGVVGVEVDRLGDLGDGDGFGGVLCDKGDHLLHGVGGRRGRRGRK